MAATEAAQGLLLRRARLLAGCAGHPGGSLS